MMVLLTFPSSIVIHSHIYSSSFYRKEIPISAEYKASVNVMMMTPPSDIFEDEQALIARSNAHVLDAYVFLSGSISPSGYINLRCIKRPDNSFLLTDNEQNMICKMIPDDSTVHRRLKLFNKEETKILTLREANGTAHGR